MLVIANNITTRNLRVAEILKQRVSGIEIDPTQACPGLKDIVEACLKGGADIIEVNLQQRLDQPDIMVFAVETIQKVTNRQICISTNNITTLEAGLRACERPPIVNLKPDEKLQEMLFLAAKYKAGVVLLISDPADPLDARQMLKKAAILVGACKETGISEENIFIDPGIFHITKEAGQRHMNEIIEFMQGIPEVFDGPIRTTCWVENGSAGAPANLRPYINSVLLAFLAGAGLSSVFINVLRQENRRTLHLLKVLRNEEIYADKIIDSEDINI